MLFKLKYSKILLKLKHGSIFFNYYTSIASRYLTYYIAICYLS